MRGLLTKSLTLALALTTATLAQADSTPLPLPFPPDRATREISVVVDKGLTRTRSLPTQELRDARVAMLDGQDIGPELLRQLAERGESLAALRYVRILTEAGIQENASDVAYFAAIAVGAGRVWVLPDMVEAMQYLSPETEPQARINKYIQVLYPHAWAGNTLALDAVIDFNGEGRLFGPLSASTRAKIEEQIALEGDGRGDLKVAVSLLRKDTLTEAEKATALTHLRRAEKADNLAVSTIAANLIEQMTADETDQSAVTN